MIYSAFEDKQLSLLGFGTMRLPLDANGAIDQEQVNAMTDYALANGVNYFDTAYPYHASADETKGSSTVSAEEPSYLFASNTLTSKNNDAIRRSAITPLLSPFVKKK